MTEARMVAALKQMSLLLVEHGGQMTGVLDERALATAPADATIAQFTRPLGVCLQPTSSLASAGELFVRTRAAILPVVAGGFVLGAVARGDVVQPLRRRAAPPAATTRTFAA